MSRPNLAALVLAAGRGERLRPLTDHTPKPLLAVGGTTLLDAALDRVARVLPIDETHVAVNAHWLAEQIVEHVGPRVHLSVEQPEALGTAGAIGFLRDWIGDRDLLVANGDVWWHGEVDVESFVEGWESDRPRLLVVADQERPDFDGKWRFAGISLLANAEVRRLPATPLGLYEAVWRDSTLDLVPATIEFIDCGTHHDLAAAREIAARLER